MGERLRCRHDERHGRSYLEPRGLAALWPKLGKLARYAATSSVAGAGIAPARLAMIYVDDAESAAEALDLVETEAGVEPNASALEVAVARDDMKRIRFIRCESTGS